MPIALAENPGRMLSDLPALPGVDVTTAELLAEDLARRGLVVCARCYGGPDASLTHAGEREVASLRTRGMERMTRLRCVMDPLLRWLYDETEECGRSPSQGKHLRQFV